MAKFQTLSVTAAVLIHLRRLRRNASQKKTENVPVEIFQSDPDESGLTLIEMIVVLAIIALIAALIVPNIIGRPDQARVTLAQTDERTIAAALKIYRLDNGDYPTTEQGLAALIHRPTTGTIPPNWATNGYLEQVPIDPWGKPYIFHSPAPSGAGYEIISLGKDGKPGGEGLDQDLILAGR